MLNIEYSVITSDVIKSFDCKKKTIILQRYHEMEMMSLLHNCILAASKRNGAFFIYKNSTSSIIMAVY